MSHPSAAAPGQASTAGERHKPFGSTSQITLEHAPGACSATRRSPESGHIRVITGPRAAGPETAEHGQP